MNLGPFTEWWACNKDSEILQDEYRDYCTECSQMGNKPLPFKKWAKEKHTELKNL